MAIEQNPIAGTDPQNPNALPQNQGETAESLQNPATAGAWALAQDKNLTTSMLYHYGYFPKEIIRFLAMRVKEAGIPCEIGFDKEFSESPDPAAQELRERYRDPRPYYFISFPLEFWNKVAQALEGSSYPLPEDENASRVAQELEEKVKRMQPSKRLRMLSFLISMMILLFGLLATWSIAELILE